MSRLNASTPRSVSALLLVEDDDDGVLEFARNGFSVIFVWERLGVDGSSCDDLGPDRSGTRATHDNPKDDKSE